MRYYSSLGDMVKDNNLNLPETIIFQQRFTKYNIGILQIVNGITPVFEKLPYEIIAKLPQKINILGNNLSYNYDKFFSFDIEEEGYCYMVSTWKDCLWLPSNWQERRPIHVVPKDTINVNTHLAPEPSFFELIKTKTKSTYYKKRYQFKKWLKK